MIPSFTLTARSGYDTGFGMLMGNGFGTGLDPGTMSAGMVTFFGTRTNEVSTPFGLNSSTP